MGDLRDRNPRLARVGSVALALLLVAIVFAAGVWVGGHPRQTGIDRLPGGVRDRLVDEDRTAIPTQVLAILQDSYYKPIDPELQARVENLAVEKLVTELGDPYTEYLDPDEYRQFLNSRAGTYVGVGIEWHPKDGRAEVVRVVPDGPASKAGIRRRDAIVRVDGRPVTADDQYAAMQTVKGEEGTEVVLRIVRAGTAERDYTITRAEIRERVVETRLEALPGKRIGYVRLDRFTSGSAKTFESAVRRFVEDDVSGIVFDLRGDPGGLVDEAVAVASVFLPEDALIAKTRGRKGPTETLTASGGAIDVKLPLVLLVDRNSASASEIVAGALRDAGRAKLVGTRTFGKALIQTTRSLANGGAIKFTTASYLTPKGFDLGERGLTPDVRAVDDPATANVDEALQRAIREVARA